MKQNRFIKSVRNIWLPVFLLLAGMFYMKPATAQVQSPCDAHPFCSDSAYVFPNATSGTTPATVTLGCLGSAPLPIWYFMQIGTPGTMQLTMVQTSTSGNQIDVDFAMFGPFTDLATGCAAILAGAAPIQCSYSSSPTETIGLGLPGGFAGGATTPPAAVAGQVYIMLLTNFSQQAGSISFSQTAGTGSADCSIVCGLSASNSGNQCMGSPDPVTLTGGSTDTLHTFTYYWSGPGGYASTGKNVSYIPTAPGTFTFDLVAISNLGDTCTASTEVKIYPKPNVALVNSADQILCNVPSTNLSIASPTTGDTYQWYKDGAPIAGATNASLTIDTTGHYKVLAENPSGCKDSSQLIYVKISHTDVDFTFAVSKACTDDTVRFTNLSEAGHYWWSYGDQTGPDDTTANPTHIYDVQNSYVVRLKVKDLDGCVDSMLKVVDVTHPLHAAFTQSTDSICVNSGTPIMFTDASVGAVTAWNWNFGDGATSSQQNPSHVYTTPGAYNVQLVVSDAIPCYDTAHHPMRVDTVPHMSFIQDRHAICTGEKINFTADYLGTAYDLSWNFGDGIVWSQFNGTSHNYEDAGTYFIELTGNYGVCGLMHATDSVVVSAYPKVDLGPDSVLCLDAPAIVVKDLNTANAGDPDIHWSWSTGATTPSISIVHPGTYSLTATRNDCATTETVEVNKDCYTDVPNAFTPNGDGVNDYFYPRQLLSKGVVGFSMTVYDRWGQKVFETTNTNGRGWDGKFNSKDQPMGVYIYQIKAVLKNGKIEEYNGNVTLVR